MVQISERVWRHWQEIEKSEEPEIALLFTSSLPAEELLAAVRRVGSGVMTARVAKSDDAEPGEDEFSPGHVSVTRMPGGVLIRIAEEPDDFDRLLHALAQALEREGIEGTFELYDAHVAKPLSDAVDLIECRLRVKGERLPHPHGPKWVWRADPEALVTGVDSGLEWCLADGSNTSLSLVVSLMPPVPLGAEDDVRAYVLQGLEQVAELGVLHLTSGAPHRFRTLAVEPSKGRLTLIEGGACIADRGWQTSVESLTTVLAAAGSWAVYGFLKRGSRKGKAELGISLDADWIPILHRNPLLQLGETFENEFVPDAFGVQLLGSGYVGRFPRGPSWRQVPAGTDAVVLEHVYLQAWFGQLLGPFGGHASPPTDPAEIPEVVASARRDFEALLFTDEAL